MHASYKRIADGADTAVLMIHGIVGTPAHFRRLIPLEEQVPENWSVWNLCLPGHGGTVQAFALSSMEQWTEAALGAFLELAERHEKIILVGHSMGTLLALELAARYPERVKTLFLLAVPLRPRVGLSIIRGSLRLVFGKIRDDRPREKCIADACGCTPTMMIWRYIPWIPRFLELFALIHDTEKILNSICAPCIVFQSREDELVSRRSEKILEKYGIPFAVLPDSGHFYYAPEDQNRIVAAFDKLKEQA